MWFRRQNSSHYLREYTFGNGKKGRNMINRAALRDSARSCVILSIWQIVSTLWPERPVETIMMSSHHFGHRYRVRSLPLKLGVFVILAWGQGIDKTFLTLFFLYFLALCSPWSFISLISVCDIPSVFHSFVCSISNKFLSTLNYLVWEPLTMKTVEFLDIDTYTVKTHP